jgi:uncharacterized protein
VFALRGMSVIRSVGTGVARIFHSRALFGLVAVALWVFLLHLSSAETPTTFAPIPPLNDLVVDSTGVLPEPTRRALLEKLSALRREKGSEVAVLIVPSTKPETIEQYSIRVVESWKLGRKGINDGALLLIALQDRAVRIEVGRGLEGDIPDVKAHRIIDEQIVPRFREGHISEGISAGVDSLERLVRGLDLPPPARMNGGSDAGAFIPILVFGWAIAAPLSMVFGRAIGALLGGVIGFAAGLLIFPAALATVLAVVVALLSFFSKDISAAGGSSYRGNRHGWGGTRSGGGFGGGGSFGGGGGFSGGGASGRW